MNTLILEAIIINFILKKLKIKFCHNLKELIQVSTYNATVRTVRQPKNNKLNDL